MSSLSSNFALEPTVWFFAGQTSPSGPIRRVEVAKTPMIIGRKEGLALTLGCSSVSKEHAEIFEYEHQMWVRDLGSTNGTYLNGQPVDEPATLSEGDILQFATVVFRVGKDVAESEDSQTVAQNATDQALSLMQFDRLIQGDAIIPFFQPIVGIAEEPFPIVAYEVLGRSRLIGLTTPGEMFATAAQLNLEAELSRTFRRTGIEYGRSLGEDVCMYVNTHPAELEGEQIVESLFSLRHENPNQKIILEIHEAAATDSDYIRRLRDVLRDLDMGLAFDDFGAGQARLVELSEVQPDCLKFDMKLVQGIHSAPASRQQVVVSLIKMVNELGIDSLVEGVEDREDHETLMQMGAKLGQGYLYGKPGPIREFQEVG